MATDIVLTQGGVRVANASDFSLEEQSVSSVYGDDQSYSLGSFTLTIQNIDDTAEEYVSEEVGLWDQYQWGVGINEAVVNTVSAVGNLATLTAHYGAGIAWLNNDIVTKPITVTRGALTTSFLVTSTAGINQVLITAPNAYTTELATNDVIPGWSGNGLQMISALAQAYGLVAYGQDLMARDTDITPLTNAGELPIVTNAGQPGRYVEVNQYQGGYTSGNEIYPANYEDNPQILSVNAGETITYELTSPWWFESVNQPDVIDFVEADPGYYDGTDGVYGVSGNDNLPITAAQWTAGGGNLSVEIKEDDPHTLVVTLTGMSDGTYSPFNIAMSSGNLYNALRLTGSAVNAVQKVRRVPTGADETKIVQDVAVTIDNPFIQTAEQAYRVGASAARRYCGFVQSMSGDAQDVHTGDILSRNEKTWRVQSVSRDGSQVQSFSADPDTRMSDFEALGFATMADFEAVWSGKTMKQFMLRPLKEA